MSEKAQALFSLGGLKNNLHRAIEMNDFFLPFVPSKLFAGTMGCTALIRQLGSHSENSVVTDHLSVGFYVSLGTPL